MTRALLAGSILNEIAGSIDRRPGFKVLVWNPVRVDIADVVTGRITDAPLDLTPYVAKVEISENIGFETATDPVPSNAKISFNRNPGAGIFRRGWVEDGVIVRILEGDLRVAPDDWTVVFTGTFRGRPGENPGTRADLSEGLSAIAYGREERYISSAPITTDSFPAGTDLGEIAYNIAWKYMSLGDDEILFGALGYPCRAITNQIVDELPLEALYECFFPVGKKPKFDALGRLCAVDVNLDKPAARIFNGIDAIVRSVIATPNDIEVNNQVILHGLDFNMTKIVQDAQVLDTIDLTTGFFDSDVKRPTYFSQDRTQRAQETYVVDRHPIKWSHSRWTQNDEFHGTLIIDTHYLRNVRAIIFGTYLALQLAIAALDYFFEGSSGAAAVVVSIFGVNITLASLRLALQIASQVALAALLWSMNYIGRGEYEIWGKPFEYVYQELVSDNRITGLDPSELRPYDYRNDFISRMEDLDALGRERLRRELVKNQTYEITLLSDPLLEVDDVIETVDGARYYINSVAKTLQRGGDGLMTLTCWKVYDDFLATAPAIPHTGSLGYGYDYAEDYGEGL